MLYCKLNKASVTLLCLLSILPCVLTVHTFNRPTETQTVAAGTTVTYTYTIANSNPALGGNVAVEWDFVQPEQPWNYQLVFAGAVVARDADQIANDFWQFVEPTVDPDSDNRPNFQVTPTNTLTLVVRFLIPGTAASGIVDSAPYRVSVTDGVTTTYTGIIRTTVSGTPPCYPSTLNKSPDLPDFPDAPVLVKKGSLVIAMDNTLQDNGGLFNVKSYGLIAALLEANIPLQWAIKNDKAKDATDFTALASRVRPTASAIQLLNFKAGPLIVPIKQTTKALAVYDALLDATLKTVKLYIVQQDIAVNVRYEIKHKIRAGVSNAGGNYKVHQEMLLLAGMVENTHFAQLTAQQILAFDQSTCYSIFAEPHFKGDSTYAAAVKPFLESGGNVIAECEGVETYSLGNFLTSAGITKDNVGDNLFHFEHDVPFSQFEGVVDGGAGGSLTDWQLNAGSTFTKGFVAAGNEDPVTSTSHIQAAFGKLNDGSATIPPVGSMVYYLGGHKYGTKDQEEINGLRYFLNAIITPSDRPGCGFDIATDIKVSISDSPDPVAVNNRLQYTVVVENISGVVATAVTATVKIEPSVEYVNVVGVGFTVNPGDVSTSGTTTITVRLGNIPATSSKTFIVNTTPRVPGNPKAFAEVEGASAEVCNGVTNEATSAKTLVFNPTDLEVYGNDIEIPKDDVTPRLLDWTDFGVAHIDAPAYADIVKEFEIRNVGPNIVTLRSIVSSNSNFEIVINPAVAVPGKQLLVGESAIVQIRYKPTVHNFLKSPERSVITITEERPFSPPFIFRYTIQALALLNEPDIRVLGNEFVIENGDNTPATSDGTDYLNGENAVREFVIHNTGSKALNVQSISIQQNQQNFLLQLESPMQLPIEPNERRAFKVRLQNLTPSNGLKSATIIIKSDDPDSSTYSFDVSAKIPITEPEIVVHSAFAGNNFLKEIVDGDTTPSKEDFTDLGTVTVGKSSSSTFSIKNVGTANLQLSAVTATNGFVISSIAPPTTLQPTAPNNVATFLVTFTGAAVGVTKATVTISNNDNNENPFNFDLKVTTVAANNAIAQARGLNDIPILNGDALPDVNDGTYFGIFDQDKGNTVSKTFKICNTGDVDLQFPATGSNFIKIVGVDSSEFSITSAQPAASATIAPDACLPITVAVKLDKLGALKAAIDIVTANAVASNPYTFSIGALITTKVDPFFKLVSPTAATTWVMYYVQRVSWIHNFRTPHYGIFKLFKAVGNEEVLEFRRKSHLMSTASSFSYRPNKVFPGFYYIQVQSVGVVNRTWKSSKFYIAEHP